MVKQELFIGERYCEGFHGKKLLVVGHQKHATSDDINNYKLVSEQYFRTSDNIDMMKELIDGTCLNGWTVYDRKSWLQFGRILTSNLDFQLGTQESEELWNSIAFCNFLQLPDINLPARQGKDKNSLYDQAELFFKEYINVDLHDAEPDKIIVWGKIVWPYIAKMGIPFDNDKCVLHLASGKLTDVMNICHPSRIGVGGYIRAMRNMTDFLQK